MQRLTHFAADFNGQLDGGQSAEQQRAMLARQNAGFEERDVSGGNDEAGHMERLALQLFHHSSDAIFVHNEPIAAPHSGTYTCQSGCADSSAERKGDGPKHQLNVFLLLLALVQEETHDEEAGDQHEAQEVHSASIQRHGAGGGGGVRR